MPSLRPALSPISMRGSAADGDLSAAEREGIVAFARPAMEAQTRVVLETEWLRLHGGAAAGVH